MILSNSIDKLNDTLLGNLSWHKCIKIIGENYYSENCEASDSMIIYIFRHSVQENKGKITDPESGSVIDITPLYK